MAQTKPPTRRTTGGYPSTPTITARQKAWRGPCAVISAIMIFGCATWLAVNLGRQRQVLTATVMLAIAITFAVVTQTAAFWRWIDKPQPTRRNDRRSPVVAHAADVPQQRSPERPTPDEIPDVKPSLSLGPEFRYIVLYGRHLVTSGRTATLKRMNEFWDQIDWSDEVPDQEISAYRDVVEFLYSEAADMPDYDDTVTQQQMLDGNVDRSNPYPFMAEVESYSPMLGAVAALMLGRKNGKVVSEDFDLIMGPWTELKLPYRLDDTIFKVDRNGEYFSEQVPDVSRTAPVPTETTAMDPFSAALAAATASMEADPKIGQATPALPPAEPVQEKHIEPETDDVPNPGTEDIVHAAELVIESDFGSTAMLQRKMRIGFGLAVKIMYRLEMYGVVGEQPAGAAPRRVYVPREELADTIDFIREKEAEAARGQK